MGNDLKTYMNMNNIEIYDWFSLLLHLRSAFEASNLEHEKELKEAENRITELKRKQQQVEHELSECKVSETTVISKTIIGAFTTRDKSAN